MAPLDAILVGYDGTEPARRALERAADLAIAFRAKVIVATVVRTHLPPDWGDPRLAPGSPLLRAPRTFWPFRPKAVIGPTGEPVDPDQGPWEQRLEDARAYLVTRGVDCELTSPIGRPVEELLDVARDRRADLIVVGSHEPRVLERLLVGSVSEGVARRARCDVLICHVRELETVGVQPGD